MVTVEILTAEFENHRSHLKSFILRMTASVEDTEDILQDTYLKAHQNIGTFRGNSSLKTWLFSVASNLARDFLREKKRWPENVTDVCKTEALGNPEFLGKMMTTRMTSPQGNFEIREHIALCFSCIAKSLPIEQQLAVLLKEVYEFKVNEIADIIDKSEAMVKYYLHTGRSKMIDIFDHRCALINKQGACHQCSELNGIFNPKQNTQEELMKIEMAREAGNLEKEQLFDLRMKIVRAIDPYNSGASEMQLLHLRHNKGVMDNYLKES
jgi:RNA polymerase sigma-70 factor, ECF subfamily